MKSFLCTLTVVFASVVAHGAVTTELRCKSSAGDELAWNFNVVSIPEEKPGFIQGTIAKLVLVSGKSEDYKDAFAGAASAHYWQEEGYSDITVLASDTAKVKDLKIQLNGELWDAMGSSDPADLGKIFIDPGQINLTLANGQEQKRNLICAIVLH